MPVPSYRSTQLSWRQDELNLVEALRHFALHYEPLKQALTTLIDTHQLVAAAHLAQSLGLFWETQDYLLEGSDHIQKILTHHTADTLPAPLKASLTQLTGDLARHRADYVLAEQAYHLTLAESGTDDLDLYGAVLRGRGEIAFRRGHYAHAAEAYQRHYDIGEQVKSPALMADSLNALGRVAAVQGATRAARDLHQEGKFLAQRSGYTYGMGWHWNAIGELHRLESDFEQAAAAFLQSAMYFERVRDFGAQTLVRQNLAFTLLALGKTAAAETVFKNVLTFWQRGRARHAIALCLIGLASVSKAKGSPVLAAQMLGCADNMLHRAGIRLEMPDYLMYEQIVSQVSKSLGRQPYTELHTQGLTIPFEHLLNIETSGEPAVSPPLLTARETQVLQCLAEGFTDKEIAARLGIKPPTINAHLKAIYRKLGVHTRTAAAHYFQSYLI